MEFMFISTRVAFGQYFMQRCVAMKTLPQGSAQFSYISSTQRTTGLRLSGCKCGALEQKLLEPQKARTSLTIGLVLAIGLGSIITPMTGLAALAYFNGCDPVQSGQLEKNDQIMPFLAAEIFKNSPGLTGLYISAAYSATLSTLSTGLNSFATVFFKSVYRKDVSDDKMIKYQRIFMLIFGYAVVLAAYCLKFLPDTVISMVFLITGSACFGYTSQKFWPGMDHTVWSI